MALFNLKLYVHAKIPSVNITIMITIIISNYFWCTVATYRITIVIFFDVKENHLVSCTLL